MWRLNVLQRGIPAGALILRVIGAKAAAVTVQYIDLESGTDDLLMESGDKVKTEASA